MYRMCQTHNGRISRLHYFGAFFVCFRLAMAAYVPSSLPTMSFDFYEREYEGLSGDYEKSEPVMNEITAALDDPETAPRLFEGDIAVDPYTYITLRLGINPKKHPKRLWSNATIPFKISTRYLNKERDAIVHALKTFNALTCINFVPYDGEVEDYIFITPPQEDSPEGCWSYVGRRGGEQVVTLQQPDDKSARCFSSEGRIMHEIMHAIGIYHEQSRSDRDKFVKIHWDNIVPKFRKNFKLVSMKQGKHPFDYDYNSVMHYGEFYFSKKKGHLPTMTPLQSGVRIGQRRTISKIDCLKINELYGCLKGRRGKMYRSFCNLLGL